MNLAAWGRPLHAWTLPQPKLMASSLHHAMRLPPQRYCKGDGKRVYCVFTDNTCRLCPPVAQTLLDFFVCVELRGPLGVRATRRMCLHAAGPLVLEGMRSHCCHSLTRPALLPLPLTQLHLRASAAATAAHRGDEVAWQQDRGVSREVRGPRALLGRCRARYKMLLAVQSTAVCIRCPSFAPRQPWGIHRHLRLLNQR